MAYIGLLSPLLFEAKLLNLVKELSEHIDKGSCIWQAQVETNCRGESSVYFRPRIDNIVMGAIALAMLGVAIWTVVQSASTEGGNVSTRIDGINVPASP